MKTKFSFLFTLFLYKIVGFSQNIKLAIQCIDINSKEKISNVIIISNDSLISNTNNYGYCALKTNKRLNTISLSHPNYYDTTYQIKINKDTSIKLYLQNSNVQFTQVAKVNKSKLIENNFGNIKMNNASFKKIPAFLSEPDPLKAIQLLPGVSSVQEGNTGIFIRGGNLDQTMIIYDEAPIYSSMHFLGLFSTFDANAIKSITLYKNAIPSKFGGRGSSILETQLREGDLNQHHQTFELGFTQSKLVLDGPIVRNKLSYFFSSRFAYPFALATPNMTGGLKGVTNYFYDYNLKLKADINKKHSIYLSSFTSKDNFTLGNNQILSTILSKNILFNRTATLRWNYIINKSIFMNTTLSYTKYKNSRIPDENSIYQVDYNGINNYIAKTDFEYYYSNKLKFIFGGQGLIYDGVSGTRQQFKVNPSIELPKNNGVELSIYGSSIYKFSNKLIATTGLRLSTYSGIKPQKISFYNIEPRIALSYQLKNKTTLNFSFDKSVQYQHLISQNLIFFPSDFWANSSSILLPQKVFSYCVGINKKIRGWDISNEVFYKKFNNTFDFKDGAQIQNNNNFENELTSLKAFSYGYELSIQKTIARKTDLNINYTYSRSLRKSPIIDNNKLYPANFDRPHILNIFTTKQIGKRITFNTLFTLQSGRPVTVRILPVLYSNRNEYRLPIYHRFDVSLSYCRNPKKKYLKSTWSFSVYNVYNRLNTYGILWNTVSQSYQSVTLFPIIPSFSYSLKIK